VGDYFRGSRFFVALKRVCIDFFERDKGMTENFYDRVAKKFGVDEPKIQYSTVYRGEAPEDVFRRMVVDVAGSEKVALDVGCGNGLFACEMEQHFGQVVGIDTSVERLKQAEEVARELGATNVRFEKQDAKRTTFEDGMFDVIYNRRGPNFYQEGFRVAKESSRMVLILIGERDTWELQQVFGRGQGFHEWQRSALEWSKEQGRRAGFEVVYGQDFFYDEYYASYQDLEIFLQSVPIFEDFDMEGDRERLERYVEKFRGKRGILLERHRIVVKMVKR
jgi:SAM-dependent methyltransferase